MPKHSLPTRLLPLLGDFDPQSAPPAISTVEGSRRPWISVMIPTFNCADLLRQTLKSVLEQDLGPERMQIEVVDDSSTNDEPEAVVQEVGLGRVQFFRKIKNEGATANFNTCIERSRGSLVHILHGDDFVLPGFFEEIERLDQRYPETSLIATRVAYINETGQWNSIASWVPEFEIPTNVVRPFAFNNPLQFAGVVVRRSFFEQHGGFRSDLVHTADYEMWERAFEKGAGVLSDKVLAAYRVFATNDTGRLMQTGENLIDRLRLIDLFCLRNERYPMQAMLQGLVALGLTQEENFRNTGNHGAADANRTIVNQIGGHPARFKRITHKLIRSLRRFLT